MKTLIKKIPIFVIAMGGLGNQMFVLTSGLLEANQRKRKLLVVTKWYDRQQRGSHLKNYERRLEISKFPHIENHYILNSKILNFLLFYQYKFALKFKKLSNSIGVVNLDLPNIKTKGALILYGNMQTDKGYEEIKNKLGSIFRMSKADEIYVSEQIRELKSDKKSLVAVHIRRGDLTVPGNIYNLLPISYYNDAISKFHRAEVKYLIFSDDISWCKEKFLGDNFIFIKEEDPVKSMRLMNLCDHYILSSSTFSWWGAWLTQSQDARIYFPRVRDLDGSACIMASVPQPEWSGVLTEFVKSI